MKFIELCNGDLLNVSQIKKVYQREKQIGKNTRNFSFIEDINGKEYDFLDLPTSFYLTDNGINYTIEDEHVDLLHKFALSAIIHNYDDGVIAYDILDREIWNEFIEMQKIIKSKENND